MKKNQLREMKKECLIKKEVNQRQQDKDADDIRREQKRLILQQEQQTEEKVKKVT